ncbi:hypothetical protein ACHAW6_004168 [Cyclotella cf. meneghiniana]
MSSPKSKMKKSSFFAKLGVKGKSKEEALDPEAQKDVTGEAPVVDDLDPSTEITGKDVDENKGVTEQPDVAPTAKRKHTFLSTKKFNVSLGRITKPHIEEVHQTEDEAASKDANIDNEDAAVGSSKDWSVEIKIGKVAKVADEDSGKEDSSERNKEENENAEAEEVKSSNPSEQPSDSPTNEGDTDPPVVDTNDKAKTKKKDNDQNDLLELKTKFTKMFRRKQKSTKPLEKHCEEEASEGYDTVKSLAVNDGLVNEGETARAETNDGEEKVAENMRTQDLNIVKDNGNIDLPTLDANDSNMPPSDEISAKTRPTTSPTSKEEADGSRDGVPGDAVIVDKDIKETSDAKPSSSDATKSSSLKSKFKKIFKSNASSSKVTSRSTAMINETSEVKGCDITESKSDLPSSDVTDAPTSSNKKIFLSDGEETPSSKDGDSKNDDKAESDPPSNSEQADDSTEQLCKDNNPEVISSNVVVDVEAIVQDKSNVKNEEATLPCGRNVANAGKTIDVPQAEDGNNASKDLNVLNSFGEAEGNRTDKKRGTKNDDESEDDESIRDGQKYDKHSRCGFGDGIHDALMHAGQFMYETCGDPDFGTAKKMLGIMEIGENAMCHCLGTSPPEKDA